MSDSAIYEGANLAAALSAASTALGVEIHQLEYELLEEERGFLGVVSLSARVRAAAAVEALGAKPGGKGGERRSSGRRPKASPVVEVEHEAPAAAPEQAEAAAAPGRPRSERHAPRPAPPEQAEAAAAPGRGGDDEDADRELSAEDRAVLVELTEGLVKAAGFAVDVAIKATTPRLVLALEGEDNGYLVDRDGRTLDALQYLVTRMARKQLGFMPSVQLDSGGFREDREAELREIAHEAADEVVDDRASWVRLEPFNPYERRIIHMTLSERGDVESKSEGDGFLKRIVVRLKGSPPPRPERGRRR